MASKSQQQQAMRAAERTGMNPWVLASVASIVLSWYEFFVRGNEEMGLFVGLWPPTFLAFASYFEQTRMSDMLNDSMGGSSLVRSVERMMP